MKNKKKIIRLKSKGMTLIEVVAVMVIIFTVGSMSYVLVQKNNQKHMTKEAQIALAYFYKAQASYHFEHNKYTAEIDKIVFPEGSLRYNVGFRSDNTARDPNDRDSTASGINNYWELCGKEFKAKEQQHNWNVITRSDCAFQTKKGKGFKPPGIGSKCNWRGIRNEGQSNEKPERYKACAVANFKKPDNSTTPHDDAEMDIWAISNTQKLHHCRKWGAAPTQDGPLKKNNCVARTAVRLY